MGGYYVSTPSCHSLVIIIIIFSARPLKACKLKYYLQIRYDLMEEFNI